MDKKMGVEILKKFTSGILLGEAVVARRIRLISRKFPLKIFCLPYGLNCNSTTATRTFRTYLASYLLSGGR